MNGYKLPNHDSIEKKSYCIKSRFFGVLLFLPSFVDVSLTYNIVFVLDVHHSDLICVYIKKFGGIFHKLLMN